MSKTVCRSVQQCLREAADGRPRLERESLLVQPSLKSARTEAVRRFAVRNRTRNSQLYLGPGSSCATPHAELRTHLLSALTHSIEAVVPGATLLQDFRWNAFSIVPNPQPEEPFCIGNFHLDPMSARVIKGIS
jgi:hypothetical protein